MFKPNIIIFEREKLLYRPSFYSSLDKLKAEINDNELIIITGR